MATLSAETQDFCDVCDLLEGDRTPKPVAYCGFCKAWLCEACKWDPERRGRAWMRRAFKRS